MNLWQRIPLAAKILSLGLVAVVVVATIKPAPEPLPQAEPKLPEVQVVIAEPSVQRLEVYSQGTVAPRREIDLVAQVGGRVTSVDADFVDGGFFTEGESLIQIDDRDYSFAHKRATATVSNAEQLLSTERGRVRQAKREWRELGNAEANALFLRKPQLAAAEAGLISAQADLNKALLDLERTRITVPFAGRIRETFVDLGQYLTPGTRIATVYDTTSAEIRLPLSDRQAALVDLPLGFNASQDNQGPAVKIQGVIGGQSYSWQGHIARTDASIDTRSRMYYAVAEVNDPFIAATDVSRAVPLIVGLFVEAKIDGRQLDNVIILPRDAVFKRDRIYHLEKNVAGEKEVVAAQVEVLFKTPQKIWIRANIAAGSEIVVGKQSYIAPGVIVNSIIFNEKNDSAAKPILPIEEKS